MKGRLISLEGPEGCGKTTAAKGLMAYFESKKIPALYTREPGGSLIAEKIRDVILDPKHTGMDPVCEALLYAASRRQHLTEIIQPAIAEGKIVLCDRYVDSSLVYQGVGRGLGIDPVLNVNRFAIGNAMPDLTFFLDLDPKIGLSRIAQDQNREVNRLDMEKLSFHQSVYQGYLTVAQSDPQRIVTINADQNPQKVIADMITVLESRLSL